MTMKRTARNTENLANNCMIMQPMTLCVNGIGKRYDEEQERQIEKNHK